MTSDPGRKRPAGWRRDQVHHAHVALILLLGRDHLPVGRPQHHRAVAVNPPRIVGRVTEILHTVGGELALLPARDILDPEIPVVDVHTCLAIGCQVERLTVRRICAGTASAAATPTATSTAANRRRHDRPRRERGARRALHVAAPLLAAVGDHDRREILGERDRGEGEALCVDAPADRFRHRHRHLDMIKRRRLGLPGRIDQQELPRGGAVPEVVVREPVRRDLSGGGDRTDRRVRHRPLGPGVVGRRQGALLRRDRQGNGACCN